MVKAFVLLRKRNCLRHTGMEEIDPLQHCRLAMLRQEDPTGRMQNEKLPKRKKLLDELEMNVGVQWLHAGIREREMFNLRQAWTTSFLSFFNQQNSTFSG